MLARINRSFPNYGGWAVSVRDSSGSPVRTYVDPDGAIPNPVDGTAEIQANGQLDIWVPRDRQYNLLIQRGSVLYENISGVTPSPLQNSTPPSNTEDTLITNAQAISGSPAGSFVGEVRVISDGENRGSRVRWYQPIPLPSPVWCWDLYPQTRYEG